MQMVLASSLTELVSPFETIGDLCGVVLMERWLEQAQDPLSRPHHVSPPWQTNPGAHQSIPLSYVSLGCAISNSGDLTVWLPWSQKTSLFPQCLELPVSSFANVHFPDQHAPSRDPVAPLCFPLG